MKTFIIRIGYNTFKRIKAVFPAYRDETTASYFSRLAKYLEVMRIKYQQEV